jgi:uncharacterized protein (TIGR03067 family)
MARRSDFAMLQGAWNGQETGVGSSTLIVDGSNVEYHGADPSDAFKATFSLRTGTNPKQIIMTIADSATPGYVGKTAHAIYELRRGTLTVSGTEPGSPSIPKYFNAADSRTLVFTKNGTAATPAEIVNTSAPAEEKSTGFISGWGDVINPDKDCTLTLENGKLNVAVPGTDHALMPARGKMNAPRIMQEVTGPFDVQVKVSANFPPGLKSAVAGRRPYQDAGLLIWLDDKNYLKLARAHIVVNGHPFDFFNLDFLHNGQYGEIPFPKEARRVLQAKPVYLRLQLHEDKTTASVSSDGTAWVTVTLPSDGRPDKLRAGIVAENNTSTPLTAAFEEFTVLPQ